VKLLLFMSCNNANDIYKTCEISTEILEGDEYVKAMEAWLECLISERIKEKTKRQLYDDIRGDYIPEMFIGFEGEFSDSYVSYKALSKILTKEELKENLTNSDPGIRYYSFLTITEKENDNVFEILKTILSDTTRITNHMGCLIDETTIADLCIDKVTEKYQPAYDGYVQNKYQLSLDEKHQLDSIVLNSELKLRYRENLLMDKKEE